MEVGSEIECFWLTLEIERTREKESVNPQAQEIALLRRGETRGSPSLRPHPQ